MAALEDVAGPLADVVLAEGVRRAYGSRIAVADLDLRIARGERFGLLGPNGAGKSTTMRMLACLSPRDAGRLEVLGLDPAAHPRALKRRLGVVAQDQNLDLELTVRENLLYYAGYFGLDRAAAAARADELLDFASLGDRSDEQVLALSGGMRRRLQIVRALVNDPEVILLDEPTTGLDPHARHVVWDRLQELGRRGATLVLTTHYMDEAARLCDRIAILDNGRIVASGPPDELVARHVGAHAVEAWFEAGVSAVADRVRSAGVRHHLRDDRVTAFGPDPDALRRLVDLGPQVRVIMRPATLEDVFLELTGHGLDGAASSAD